MSTLPDTPTPELLAAVDLGSNSFHMVVAQATAGDLRPIDRLKEPVRLAAGLDERLLLGEAAIAAAVRCLERFGQRLRDVPAGGVRAVATSTLRRASNREAVLERFSRALGQPIEVISGREEARLIYLGVSHSVADVPGRRLVVDIGGGSTECIVGEHFTPLRAESLEMGCVGYTQRFFDSGAISRAALREAITAAHQELEPVERQFRAAGWRSAVGSSGTIEAVADILRAWRGEPSITPVGLEALAKEVVQAGHSRKLDLPGLKSERAPVLTAGVAILSAVFEALHVREMTTATGALREGVLYDLLGRHRHEDVRDRTVELLADRHRLDAVQAARVQATALDLFEQVRGPWGLAADDGRWLAWAARLHELGLAIAWTGYHKHGAYILQNADMPGFSRDDQALLAELVRLHRKKPGGVLRDLPPTRVTRVLRLAVLLRLAVVLHRGRSEQPVPVPTLEARSTGAKLRFPGGWLADHPLTAADLAGEVDELRDADFELKLAADDR
jgi:exopolyphosphatase/guanosine-5'-triphosphate,3'-diphosphate pyrophosphatase